ncbi:MotA/TolQ/ExbB proton channel family protein [Alteromonas sp. McT4-15]|uniref:MotA/TolQ/ExbB proton channel family protein n=1 Tax=Alteromonas sp. McT4-15 TaxID=2881256 RepID=UPI001CF86FB7|nr:MotA/TolQ/ExbB proton channel family protein [Alteromonas sp. McT4-15]MCB4437688.1 MotA/TolQ/ExbB proton channel family protein [Alteromonas sp. McT4-15]
MRCLNLLVMLCLATYTLSGHATTAQSPNGEMLKKIEQAKARLAQTESSISKARVSLSNTLNALEQEVIALREATSVARRKADEKTLGLVQLEERLARWQEQHVFQEDVINRFLRQVKSEKAELKSMTLSEKVQSVLPIAKSYYDAQFPQFQAKPLVLSNGELVDAQLLTLGPVTWYLTHAPQVSGLATFQNSHWHADTQFSRARTQQLFDLLNVDSGAVVFDPTLGRAVTQSDSSESLHEHVIKGGLWVIPIVLFGILALSIALFKVAQLWRLPTVKPVTSAKALSSLLHQSSINHFSGMQRELIDIAQGARTPFERDDELFAKLQAFKYKLEKYNGAISITAAVAPLLGLLGTVSGMIETFRMMTAFGSSDPEIISGGIAKALVTTELGLVVAIPALILNAILSRKAKTYYDSLESFALVISSDSEEARVAS